MLKVIVVYFGILLSALFSHTGKLGMFTLAEGFLHPFCGLDHILAMFAVGIFAAMFRKKDIAKVLIAFILMMILSAFLGTSKVDIPFIETGIIASIFVFAIMIVFAARISIHIALLSVGIFAMFHGYVHGFEFSGNGSFIGYIAGFSFSTLIIHITGLAAGLLFARARYFPKEGIC